MKKLFTLYLITLLWTLHPAAAYSTPARPQIDRITKKYSHADMAKWTPATVDSTPCLISPAIVSPEGCEINFHKITADFAGPGQIKMSIGYSDTPDLQNVIAKSHLHTRLKTLKSGASIEAVSRYKGQRYAWLILQPAQNVRIKAIRYQYSRTKEALYGHTPGTFTFANNDLPYRFMFPRNYDPAKKYPLVISVSGSGGIGTDNKRSMEQVIFARYLFTNYYHKREFECFSLVTQIPPMETVPAPYFPKGKMGAPTPYHPDWPAVNENGWYTHATLKLVQTLIDDKNINIDNNRVYLTGFSYGGKACWEFLKADHDLFAAAIPVAGWPIGPVGSTPSGQYLTELKQQVKQYKHVPTRIFAGDQDPMRFGSKAVYEEIAKASGDSLYIEFPKTNHVATAAKVWGNIKYTTWLFANRKDRPKPGKPNITISTEAKPNTPPKGLEPSTFGSTARYSRL